MKNLRALTASSSSWSKVSENNYIAHAIVLHSTCLLNNLILTHLSLMVAVFLTAYWYYEDLLADAGDDPDQPDMPKIPHYKSLHAFAKVMFKFSPLLEPMLPEFDSMYGAFSNYKRKIGTYGTILLNQDCTRILLCQAYFGNSWTFPAGKVNQNEAGVEAGARETYEETGFDPNCQVGETKRLLEAAAERGEDLPWSGLRSEDALTYIEEGSKKRRTCYVCRGVPEDFPFEPVARKEVKDTQWFDIYDIPKKSYAVIPFIKPLRRWIRKNAKDTLAADSSNGNKRSKSQKKGGRDGSTKKGRASSRASSRGASRGKVREDEDLALSGLAAPGDEKGWTAEDMFKANEMLTGKKTEYDGNPHVFAERGFDGIDPHAFRVVGGGFMNSGEGIQGLAPAPEKSRLQPLFREGNGDDGEELTPFFSKDGATPWGEVVKEEVGTPSATGKKQTKGKKSKKKKNKEDAAGEKEEPLNAGKTLLSMLQGKGVAIKMETKEEDKESSVSDAGGTFGAKTALGIFMTDKEITSRSQNEKLGVRAQEIKQDSRTIMKRDDDEHIIHMRKWAENLPQTFATDVFGDFRFDQEAILKAMLGVQP